MQKFKGKHQNLDVDGQTADKGVKGDQTLFAVRQAVAIRRGEGRQKVGQLQPPHRLAVHGKYGGNGSDRQLIPRGRPFDGRLCKEAKERLRRPVNLFHQSCKDVVVADVAEEAVADDHRQVDSRGHLQVSRENQVHQVGVDWSAKV